MINLVQGDCLEKMKDYLLTVQYRDDPELSERHMTREDAFAKANNLDLSEIEWAEVSDPDGVMLWDHISGRIEYSPGC
jgi:hypothetical protein